MPCPQPQASAHAPGPRHPTPLETDRKALVARFFNPRSAATLLISQLSQLSDTHQGYEALAHLITPQSARDNDEAAAARSLLEVLNRPMREALAHAMELAEALLASPDNP